MNEEEALSRNHIPGLVSRDRNLSFRQVEKTEKVPGSKNPLGEELAGVQGVYEILV